MKYFIKYSFFILPQFYTQTNEINQSSVKKKTALNIYIKYIYIK